MYVTEMKLNVTELDTQFLKRLNVDQIKLF